MAAGGGHLHRGATHGLTAHVGQVGRPGAGGTNVATRGRRIGPRVVAAEAPHELAQRVGGADPHPSQQRRLPGAGARYDHGPGGHGRHHGDDPRDGPERPVEPQLAQEGAPGNGLGRQLVGCHEQPDGDGQVEPRTALADPRRSEVDGDPLGGPRQAAGEERGPDPVARLAHGRVGQSHHVERGQPGGHVDLHDHGTALYAQHGGGWDGGDHGG
jgi:hypothetical protein